MIDWWFEWEEPPKRQNMGWNADAPSLIFTFAGRGQIEISRPPSECNVCIQAVDCDFASAWEANGRIQMGSSNKDAGEGPWRSDCLCAGMASVPVLIQLWCHSRSATEMQRDGLMRQQKRPKRWFALWCLCKWNSLHRRNFSPFTCLPH